MCVDCHGNAAICDEMTTLILKMLDEIRVQFKEMSASLSAQNERHRAEIKSIFDKSIKLKAEVVNNDIDDMNRTLIASFGLKQMRAHT